MQHARNMTQTPITVGSMFAGIGGIDLGFVDAGFTIKWANEIDKKSCWYNMNGHEQLEY